MHTDAVLPPIPAKRYFTIGEVGELCGVKPHVLRYWEQEFVQLKPVKRRGNRRYYQHHEVLMIRRIRDLLYEQGFTISGARNKLTEFVQSERERRRGPQGVFHDLEVGRDLSGTDPIRDDGFQAVADSLSAMSSEGIEWMRHELSEIRTLLSSEGQLTHELAH
ncbi:MAG: MerR family transcriptional regulator [Betaproteobacteria bacterium]|nr:MerR family transcriptional regulator [Betaproteobacteria bacterium]